MRAPEHGLTAKNRAMLRCFHSKKAKLKLLQLPFTLLAKVEFSKPLSQRDARKVQTALLLRLLLRAPMRVSNIAGFASTATSPGPVGRLASWCWSCHPRR